MMGACGFAFMLGLGVAWKHQCSWKMNVLYYGRHLGEFAFSFSFFSYKKKNI
jgi:hypothetical protein